MSDNKITQDQLEPNVMEELESGIGDLSELSTENKGSLVAAVTEIYGKSIIADAIGEPLTVNSTFNEMENVISNLLSTFKTNMMNNGITVESGDKFKALIDKIATLADSEGKGIKYASGSSTETIRTTGTDGTCSIITGIDFKPTVVFVHTALYTRGYYSGDLYYSHSGNHITLSNLGITDLAPASGATTTVNIDATNNIVVQSNARGGNYGVSILEGYDWYAIGVGEEDTTLRDSLASILESKGVEVTEEDDIASLICKVENIETKAEPKLNYKSGKVLTLPVSVYTSNQSHLLSDNIFYYLGTGGNSLVTCSVDSDYNLTLINNTAITDIHLHQLVEIYNNKLITYKKDDFTLNIMDLNTRNIVKSVVVGELEHCIQVSKTLNRVLINNKDGHVLVYDYDLELITDIAVDKPWATLCKEDGNIYLGNSHYPSFGIYGYVDIYNEAGELLKTTEHTVTIPFIAKGNESFYTLSFKSDEYADYFSIILVTPEGTVSISPDFGSETSVFSTSAVVDCERERISFNDSTTISNSTYTRNRLADCKQRMCTVTAGDYGDNADLSVCAQMPFSMQINKFTAPTNIYDF